MILFKRSADISQWLDLERNKGRRIGFVPTMGALHEGHTELIKTSVGVTDISVCSIFVNPAQFNDPKDYEKYPVSIEQDIETLTRAGTTVLFLPGVDEIYPEGRAGLETYALGDLENLLEGAYRPGHFQGVCQVMSRLLRLVRPSDLFMGQKDFQQCMVVRKLIAILGMTLKFHAVPTVREGDGLAKSSRNRRLTEQQRENAAAIFRGLRKIKEQLHKGNNTDVLESAEADLRRAGFKPDYLSLSSAGDLHPIQDWDGREYAVVLIAALQGEVRLIDNMLIN